MRWTTRLRLFLRSLFLSRRVEQDLDAELQFHVQTYTDLYLARGLTPEDARAAALRDLGGLEQRKEECRDTRGVARLEHLLRDSRYALRMLRRNPGFAVLGILIMALGIGANTAVFSVVYTVLLKPLPFHEPDRIVTLTNVAAKSNSRGLVEGVFALGRQISAPNFWDWHEQATTFDALAYYATSRTPVGVGTAADYAQLTVMTPELFGVLAVTPTVGRGFTAGEQQPGLDVGEQHRVVQPGLGEPVAVAARDAGVQPVRA